MKEFFKVLAILALAKAVGVAVVILVGTLVVIHISKELSLIK